MSKPSKRSRKRSCETVDRSATTDVVTQLECAIRRPQATLIGALVGGLVPWFARTLAHEEVPTAWTTGSRGLALVMLTVVLGCACFSALTVYKFGRATFGDKRKALGFVLAIEGVMLVSHGVTSMVALMVLIAINALANGSAIALARDATCRRQEADARRAAARSRKRSEAATHSAPPMPPHSAPSMPRPQAHTEVPHWQGGRAPAHTAARSRRAPHMAIVPDWADVVEAEIISEQRLLA